MYNPQSLRAEEFINHAEILDTLEYARAHKNDTSLLSEILAKAARRKGLNHREAAVLLLCEDDAVTEQMNRLARQIKLDFYGSRIVIFAPLYLSNYCVNGCTYCPYHAKNKHISRKKLSQEDIVREVTALQDMGHKRLAIEAGEDPLHNPISYILECIDTIYHIHHKNGAIRRVNVNIAATTEEEYHMLKEAGIGTYILFQETYHKESYEKLHPTGPKHNYDYHTEAMDRAMAGGIDDVGLGVLFGLENYPYELVGLSCTQSIWKLSTALVLTPSAFPASKAEDINPDDFDNGISDDIFAKICALIRISVPYTGMIISTRKVRQYGNGCFRWAFPRSAAAPVPASAATIYRKRLTTIPHSLMSATGVRWTKWCGGSWKWTISPVFVPPVIVPDAPATGSWLSAKADRSRTAATPTLSLPYRNFWRTMLRRKPEHWGRKC